MYLHLLLYSRVSFLRVGLLPKPKGPLVRGTAKPWNSASSSSIPGHPLIFAIDHPFIPIPNAAVHTFTAIIGAIQYRKDEISTYVHVIDNHEENTYVRLGGFVALHVDF